MCKCSICSKEREGTYPVTLKNGLSYEVCPRCLLKNLKRKLLFGAVIAVIIAVVLIMQESRGLSDTLIMIGILAVALLFLYGIFMITANDAKKERLYQLGKIEKRGWPITVGYDSTAHWVMHDYAIKKGLFKEGQNVTDASSVSSKTPSVSVDKANYRKLADQLAHYQSFSMDQSEVDAMEKGLLAGGEESLNIIMNYLLSCGSGAQTEYWWNNARGLVKLIRRFPDADHKALLQRLLDRSSNIWEYHTQIKDVAEQELLALKKASSIEKGIISNGISAEDAHAELKAIENIGSPETRLKRLYEVRDSVQNWACDDKAYYYFIAGDAARVLYPDSDAKYAFYAAQVFYNPVQTSLGWMYLREIDSLKNLDASPENAKSMHDKYRLPESMEELAEYKVR